MSKQIWKIRIQEISPTSTADGENQPAVERSRPAFTASARLDPKIGGRSLDHIAKPDLLAGDKSGQAHSMSGWSLRSGRAFLSPRFCRLSLCAFVSHAICLFVIRCQQDLIGRGGIQQRGNDRGSPRPGHNDGEFDLRRGCGRKFRPQQRNGAGHKRHGNARTAKRERLAFRAQAGNAVAGCAQAPLPIEPPRFDSFIGRPRRSQATTGMTHG